MEFCVKLTTYFKFPVRVKFPGNQILHQSDHLLWIPSHGWTWRWWGFVSSWPLVLNFQSGLNFQIMRFCTKLTTCVESLVRAEFADNEILHQADHLLWIPSQGWIPRWWGSVPRHRVPVWWRQPTSKWWCHLHRNGDILLQSRKSQASFSKHQVVDRQSVIKAHTGSSKVKWRHISTI